MIAGKGNRLKSKWVCVIRDVALEESCEEDSMAAVSLVRKDHGKGTGLIWANLLDGACSYHRLVSYEEVKVIDEIGREINRSSRMGV